MTSGPDLPPLSRDAFVANVLWIGVNLACQGTLGRELDFRGNHRRGEVSCDDGQGDNLHVLWDEEGVVALVHEHELPRHVPFDPPPPPPLQGLAELGGRKLSGLIKATGCLWICGDRSSPRLKPSPPNSLLGILDAFCGPLLISSDEDDVLERALYDAIGDAPAELPSELVRGLLDGPLREESGNGLEAARYVAEDLGRFGLLWSTVERDVAERG